MPRQKWTWLPSQDPTVGSSQPPIPASSFEKDREDLASSSQYPHVSGQAYIDLLPNKTARKRLDPTEESILDAAMPSPIPLKPKPDLTDRSPDNPFRHSRQVGMINSLRLCGPTGLAQYLYTECRKYCSDVNTAHNTWNIMLDDQTNNTQYATLLLSMLPQVVIESLIKGTLMNDVGTNSDVKKYYRAFMRHAGEYPGIYFNTLGTSDFKMTGAGVPRLHPGKWLSTDQIESLLTKFTDYIDGTDPAFQATVDSVFGAPAASAGTAARYAENQRQVQTSKSWIDVVRTRFCDRVPSSEKHRPHISAPFEVGWSRNVQRRIPQHKKNAGTTPIFGFNNAITRLPVAKGGFGFPSDPFSGVLFPIWEDNKELARVGEILGSMLVGSYWFQGGYNSTWAGTLSLSPGDDIDWELARKHALDRLQHCEAPDALILQAQRCSNKLNVHLSLVHKDSEVDALKASLRSAKEAMQQQEGKAQARQEQLRRKYQEFESIRDARFNAVATNPGISGEDKEAIQLFKETEDNSEYSGKIQEECQQQIGPNFHGRGFRRSKVPTRTSLTNDEQVEVSSMVESMKQVEELDWERYLERRRRQKAGRAEEVDD
ncbi:MAG: hypothetical protein Q9192_002094 [Flavoplaca navasiana]